MFQWPWGRPAAAGPIGPLAWKLPYATGVAIKRKKKKRKRNSRKLQKEKLEFGIYIVLGLISHLDRI